jgi:phenylpropionate dioxygenase-like ring-hydroxylating dioxygenase large terminal subunit
MDTLHIGLIGLSVGATASAIILGILFWKVYADRLVPRFKDHLHECAPRQQFDVRRGDSYPAVPNTWYALAYSNELVAGDSKPLHVRALGQSFAVWRTKAGKLVVQEAWCPHQGANIAVGGNIKDDCIQCPFHNWKFSESGDVVFVPAAKYPEKPQPARKLRNFPSRDWCGLALVYFHADMKEGEQPEWFPPEHVENQIDGEKWQPLVKADFGLVALSPVDWVDQAGDHSHFHELHAELLIPWTTKPLPAFLRNWLNLRISHKVETYLADSEQWLTSEAVKRKSEYGYPLACTGKQYIFFTDDVKVLRNNKPIESTGANTLEMYIGPAMMCFHIPFGIGILKIFVCTTPMEGHSSIMRVQSFVNSRSPIIQAIGWIVAGVSASQLAADIDIMCNKVRLRKPMKQLFDGPQTRVMGWMKQFYSESSANVGRGLFVPDW